jgi:aspartate/methionine/tyrosine aminotransferase
MLYAGKITQIPKEVANLLNHFKTASRVSGIKPSGILRLFTLAKDQPNTIGLGLGEPDFVPPPHVLEAVKQAKRGHC